jgi:uncharacterized protein (TIGR00369 family)
MSAVDVTTLPPLPVREALGGTLLAVDNETGAGRIRYLPGERLANTVGHVFGGFLAAMVDDAAGLAAWFGGGQRMFATAQLSVNFLRPAKPDDVLVADVAMTSIGSKQMFVDVKIAREVDGKLLVTGTVIQVFVGEREKA